MMGAWWLVAAQAAPECGIARLEESIARAQRSFAEMNEAQFDSHTSATRRTLRCLSEPLSPLLSAEIHRVEALSAFTQEDEAGTILAFAAEQASFPALDLAEEIAPPGHPLRRSYEAALTLPSDDFDLPRPETGWLSIDGARSRTAPAGRPFVFQQLSADGSVRQSAYVAPGARLPDYPERPPSTGLRSALVGSGLALGVGAAGMYGGALVSRGTYEEVVQAGDEDRIWASYRATNGLLIGSASSLIVGGAMVLFGAL